MKELSIKGRVNKNIFAANKCLILLVFFLIWFFTGPLLLSHPHLSQIYVVAYLILMICGVYALTGNRVMLGFSIAVAIFASYEWITHFYHPDRQMMELCGFTVVLFDFTMTASMILYTVMAKKFNRDMLFGIIFTFFMIGQSFGDAFYVMQFWGTVQFRLTDAAHTVPSMLECIYFSFSTLTTTGYGDILPATDFAKRMSILEQSIGVLYVAVFIGRLLNAYGNGHQNQAANEE
ncbi:MAG: potassium channel family protein [Victivallales bacterium]|nr:potassium channel family protein [Victivallales bacterium]